MKKSNKQVGALPEGAIVGGDKSSPLQPVAKFLPKKRLVLSIVAIVLVIGLVVGGLVGLQQYNKRQNERYVCANKQGKGVSDSVSLSLSDTMLVNELKKATDSLKTNPGYEKDPVCIYPILVYYIYKADTRKANEYYTALEKVYDEKRLQAAYPKNFKKLGELKKQIDKASEANKELLKTVIPMSDKAGAQ